MSAEDREDFHPFDGGAIVGSFGNRGRQRRRMGRLISSYGILGEVENAKIIWTEAQAVFGSDQGAMEQLRAAAKSAGAIE